MAPWLISIIAMLPLLIAIGWGIKATILEQRARKRDYEKLDGERSDVEPQTFEVSVYTKWIEKRYLGRGRGYEYQYMVMFWTDDGEDFELAVSQDFYDGVTEEQTGRLVLLGERILGFEPYEKTIKNDEKGD